MTDDEMADYLHDVMVAADEDIPTLQRNLERKLEARMADEDDLKNRFTYHPPKPGQNETYERLREGGLLLAHLINASAPTCREKALAITKLEEAIFWANAGIARHG